ncbi:MAG: UDP-N-acetylmuramoylalanine--D-glutamate ligase [Lentisphaerae bacterium RIFOXYC12_FULL_60_16]|nr:MAG: UDP-N-acetylmuramoylalanine--D-glutamate ligase [Lentisphaerae bacterium RIFOXYC12_FULL_60_16]OGV86474.1 MAG: UDP-N-acetylmuramoylalanine--D-glutamate ligase [Lentisphaerae bacterium RIFOXYB12_FULL_60_10]
MRVLILGMGRSGDAAARLLRREGAQVRIVDQQSGAGIEARAESLRLAGVEVFLGCVQSDDEPLGGLPPAILDGVSYAVLSPGVDTRGPWVSAVETQGISLMGEIELGFRRLRCPVIGVTGSKGKSTLVKLITEVLQSGGRQVEAGGNYGTPVSTLAMATAPLDAAVLEISSFQLERIVSFRPAVGILLNLQPDHLDRHDDMAAYLAIKARLFENMGAGDTVIIPEPLSDRLCNLERSACRRLTFGEGETADYRYRCGCVVRRSDRTVCLDLNGTYFGNPVTGLTAAAAVAAVESWGCDLRQMAQVVQRFQPLPHRMQEVGKVRGVRFIDDSKATNLAALEAGVMMANGAVRLIAGGMLKETPCENVKDLLVKRIRGLYLIGRDAAILQRVWGMTLPCRLCGDMETAVRCAFRDAVPGETVLLSPGAASFDQFSGYAERGERFKSVVDSLKDEEMQL